MVFPEVPHADGGAELAELLAQRLAAARAIACPVADVRPPPPPINWPSCSPNRAADSEHRLRAITDLVVDLGAPKVIMLGRRSGLQTSDGDVPSLVNLTLDFQRLSGPGVLSAEQRQLLANAAPHLRRAEHSLTIAITSPLDLLRELFTVKGAGTLIRRGASIEQYGSYVEVDHSRLRDLLERAFGSRPAIRCSSSPSPTSI